MVYSYLHLHKLSMHCRVTQCWPFVSSPGFSLRFISRWGRALGEKWQRDMLKKQLASYKRETGAVAGVVWAAEFDTSPNLMGALSASICRWFDYQQPASRLLEKRFAALSSTSRKSWTSKKGRSWSIPQEKKKKKKTNSWRGEKVYWARTYCQFEM